MEEKINALRNPDGIWINTNPFRQEAIRFAKEGTYCHENWGSKNWYDYWTEQRERCINGYSCGGARITGDHYFYLNFCPIRRVEESQAKVSKKITSFPDFWDGDYNYFWCREIAKNGLKNSLELKNLFLEISIDEQYLKGGFNLIVGKSRRKGYSYKSASIATNNYFSKPMSLTIFNAYEKKYLAPKGVFSMTMDFVNFINLHTAWVMPSDVINRSDHIKSSYITYKDGVKIEKGFKSEIMAMTCKDNPDANRGKDAEDIFIEEAGAFGVPGLLKELYFSSEDCVKAGGIKTGMITIFGTSGDMEQGTVDYADMHSRPLAYGLLPFNNVWDKAETETYCGFFHPVNWNMEGYYDKNGNSKTQEAKEQELLERNLLIENGASSSDIQRRVQEKPLTPAEAFAVSSTNIFPTQELKIQLSKVKSKGWQKTKGTPITFYFNDGKVSAKPLLSNAEPITSYYASVQNKSGCPIIYEFPLENTPKGLYKIGYDPVRQDEGTSLCGIIVYKGAYIGSTSHNVIVAEYVGRLDSAEDMDRMAEYFAEYYNTTVMYENEIPGVKNYFRRIKKLHLLATQPDLVISKSIKNSRVSRIL